MAVIAYAVSLPLLFWMTPVIIGLLLCIPIAMLSSRRSRPKCRLWRTPEETSPPQVLVRANELAKMSSSRCRSRRCGSSSKIRICSKAISRIFPRTGAAVAAKSIRIWRLRGPRSRTRRTLRGPRAI